MGSAVSQRRFVILAIALGIAVPALWLIAYWLFLRGNPALTNSIMSTSNFDRVLLAVWPSWIFFVADPEEQSITIPAMSIAANALLYGSLGWLVWFGLYRRRAVLGLAAMAVLVGWYFLFSWYLGG